ncbi:hypothetical protein CS062_17455 [Roseateles chitinivorans]|uniref:Uncharacterized protein n=1 Tax=Roseateles chitinivorans TaxID=2917965 RepID=A0A2G9C6E2_9BURK|nr:hypothetical protein [Roseateles chitinivorans]PIM51912.1 hypothetical protein CS062_17455 [Roseateles chitinivorans]
MNCKPGDRAIVVAPFTPNGRGAVVTVERRAAPIEFLNGVDRFESSRQAWVVNGWVRSDMNERMGPQVVVADRCLRPLPKLTDDELDQAEAGKPTEQVPA